MVESGKETQLDNACRPLVDAGKGVERLVHLPDVDLARAGGGDHVQGHPRVPEAALEGPPLTRVIDQDLAHRDGGHGGEVLDAVPRPRRVAGQAQVRFVDEDGRLQHLVRVFPLEVTARERPELLVDQGHQVAGRRRVAFSSPETPLHVGGGRWHRAPRSV